jgi:hypothetical protein
MNVSDFEAIVFDEIFFHAVPKLARIGVFMRKHERLRDLTPRKFYATGDPFQNPPIEVLGVADARTYYMDAVSTLFPYQLVLRECKRVKNADQQQRLEAIKERLFTLKHSPSAVIRSFAKPIKNLADVKGSAICYLNETASAINHYLHEKAVEGRDVVAVGGNSYYAGLELVCRRRLDGIAFADTSEKKRGVLHVNYTYVVVEAQTDALVLDDLDGCRLRVPFSQALHHLAYSHAFTGHSQQGLSVDGAVTIFDYKCSFEKDGRQCGVTAEWAYTALSRARDLDLLYVFVGKLGDDVDEREVSIAIERKIYGHMCADKRAGRTWDGDYITVDGVFQLWFQQGCKCALCDKGMQLAWRSGDHEQASIDRIDNALAHIKSNCRLTCLQCNKRKQ